ncbi:hypothetical protein R6242_18775 [Iodobacter sp. CM08]|uniref:hypothetical protein n=1 Tax=Iodobacter sp. CM08 TaxID=3085902 RepID=UPI00298149C4|nr:hypothetical protein [Iodobacter sp. CM08]MDW5418613.1 hypothetical protein [Iodobacter sp. CM08]
MKQNAMSMAIALVLSVSSSVSFAAPAAPQSASQSKFKDIPPFIIERGLIVLDKKPGPKGMTAWVVTSGKGTDPAVMFTSPNGDIAVAGVIWDTKTGKVLSGGYLPDAKTPASDASANKSTTGASEKGIHPAALSINTMRGFLDGKPRPADQLLYVIFDPTCPVCHDLYKRLRPYVANNSISVKWLPVVVLGKTDADRAKSMDSVAAAFNMKNDAAAINALFSDNRPTGGKPDKSIVADLIKNEVFLRSSYKGNAELGQVAVPTAYFFTNAGEPVLLKAGDPAVLKQILQDIKK